MRINNLLGDASSIMIESSRTVFQMNLTTFLVTKLVAGFVCRRNLVKCLMTMQLSPIVFGCFLISLYLVGAAIDLGQVISLPFQYHHLTRQVPG